MTSYFNIKVFVLAACVLCALGGRGNKQSSDTSDSSSASSDTDKFRNKKECAGRNDELTPCSNNKGICWYVSDVNGIHGKKLRCLPFCGYPTELPANSQLESVNASNSLNFIGGSVLNYTCDTDYVATCPTEIYCLENGEWSPAAFECLRAPTPAPTTEPATVIPG